MRPSSLPPSLRPERINRNNGRNLMANKDYYNFLGLPTDCSPDEIYPAYQKHLAVYENINQGDAEKLKLGRTVLGKAYLTLSDPEKRFEYDKKNKIKKRYKYKKNARERVVFPKYSGNGFLSRIFISIFSALWSIFKPILRLALLVAFIWGVFFSDYTAEYRRLAYEKGRVFVGSLLPEPADPYESLRCQKIRTNIADLVRQERELSKSASSSALVGIGAAILSALADKKEIARAAARSTIRNSVPAAKRLNYLRKTIRDEKIDNLECFEREVGRGQQLGGITQSKKVQESKSQPPRIIERRIIIKEREPELKLNACQQDGGILTCFNHPHDRE
jgi:curved DNA-binding protein CbpA